MISGGSAMKKVYQITMLIALFFSSLGFIAAPQYNVSAKSCPVGYVTKKGKCVPIEITQNKDLSKIFHCLANHGQSVDTINKCMKSHK
jgi:hypothetical protein